MGIYDAKGAQVQLLRVEGPAAIDLSGLSRGIYLLRATSQGTAQSQRFVKE